MTHQDIFDQALRLLDIGLRRWFLIILPLLICAPIAYIAVKSAAKSYTSSTAILLRPAQQAGWSGSPQSLQINGLEQVAAIEAWLKSDQVMEQVLPLVTEEPVPKDPEDLFFEIKKLRTAIRLHLRENSVLVVELDGDNPVGLGRRLERVLTHIMDGLLRPDNGLLTAGQLILLSRQEAAREAELELLTTIRNAGFEDPAAVVGNLRTLVQLQREQALQVNVSDTSPGRLTEWTQDPRMEEVRAAITNDPQVLRKLIEDFTKAGEARDALEQAKRNTSSTDTTYPGIFEAPQRLTVIGRPRDPLFGVNPVKKIAIAAMLLSLVFGGVLALLAEIWDKRLRTRQQVEELTGLPVLARFSIAS